MKVEFINDAVPIFECTNGEELIKSLEYRLPIPSDANKFSIEDYANQYEVNLLINPYLSNGADIFCLKHKDFKRTVGIIFPVSNLDEDSDIQNVKQYDYFFVAFYTLLKRLRWDSIKEDCFSDNFEKNICACVFNKRQAEEKRPLHLCMHTLRKYGYSYFEDNNNVEVPTGYDKTKCRPGKNIMVNYEVPKLYHNDMVKTLLEELPKASNIVHRFVLLYQVIELLMDVTLTDRINQQYDKFRNNSIPNNDFLHSIQEKMSEKSRINDIFELCHIKATNECVNFKNSCKILFHSINYQVDENADSAELFYNFRNKLTHQYRDLMKHQSDLAHVVQDFESLIMLIIEKYPNYIA